MDRDILHQRLVSYAHWAAASQGFRFGTGAEADIDNIAQHAIDTMFGASVPKRMTPRHQAMMAQAEAALSALVAAMIEARGRNREYAMSHPNEIGEWTLGEAKAKLCPIFPIC